MSVPPAVMRRLMRELSELKKNPPEGIRVVTSEENMLDVTGIIEGPEGTPYAGGYFRIKFKFTEEFPAAPPKCWLATKIFHPNVSTTGEICVNTLKKDWNSSYGIGHILITVKCLLIYPNPESALDEEAGKLLLENYDSYHERAKLITTVHATPRVRPPEFDTPSSSSVTTSAPAISLLPKSAVPLPSQPPIPPAASTPILALPIAMTTVTRKSASPAPATRPLRSSPSNTLPSATFSLMPSLSADKDGKEGHTLPSPLGTADANVGAGTGMGAGTGTPPTMTATPKKAVKRAATGGGAAGAEKRKKALKRL